MQIVLSKLSFRQLYAIGKPPLFSRARYVVSSFILNFKVLSEVPSFWEFNFARLGSFLYCTTAIMPCTDDV